jgi:hypothetical protein
MICAPAPVNRAIVRRSPTSQKAAESGVSATPRDRMRLALMLLDGRPTPEAPAMSSAKKKTLPEVDLDTLDHVAGGCNLNNLSSIFGQFGGNGNCKGSYGGGGRGDLIDGSLGTTGANLGNGGYGDFDFGNFGGFGGFGNGNCR